MSKSRSDNVSLQKVSELAGVSRCTASRILNRNPNYTYSEDTVKKVFQIANATGYRTSQLYKSLFSGSTKSIGLITSNRIFFSRITNGIHDRLLLDNYALLLGVNNEDYENKENSLERKIIHRLNEHRVDGFIIRPTVENASNEHFNEIISMNLPLVAIDRKVQAPYADFVGSDNEKGGRLAAEHLIRLGHRNILQIADNQEYSTYRERSEGFNDELIKSGIIPQTITCLDLKETATICKTFFGSKKFPTAVFCNNDSIAGMLYRVLYDLGLRVPDDVSIIGFGNQLISAHYCPTLASIEQYPTEMGRAATELLLSRLDAKSRGETYEQKDVRIPVSLVENESCRAIKTN